MSNLQVALVTPSTSSCSTPATAVVLVRETITSDIYAPALDAGVGAVGVRRTQALAAAVGRAR